MWRLRETVNNYYRYNHHYLNEPSEYCNTAVRLWKPIWFDQLGTFDFYKLPVHSMKGNERLYSYSNISKDFKGVGRFLTEYKDKSENHFYIGYGVVLSKKSIGLLVCRSTIDSSLLRTYISKEFVSKDSIYKNLYKRFNTEFIEPYVEQGMQVMIVNNIEEYFVDKLPLPQFSSFEEMQNYYNTLGEKFYIGDE